MVAQLGLLDSFEVFVERIGVGEGGPVHAGQHHVLFVPAPVSTGDREELEMSDVSGVGKMRSPAEVPELPLPVQGDGFRSDVPDQLGLEGVVYSDRKSVV